MSQRTLDQRMLGVGTALTDHTITASDVISFADVGASNAIKRDTVQGVLDLAGGGGLVWLARATLAGAAAYDFESVISSTYDNYKFVMAGIHISGANSFYAQVSTDNGSNWENSSGDYKTALDHLDSNTSTPGSYGNDTVGYISLAATGVRGLDTLAQHAYGGVMELFEVHNTAHYKFATFHSGHHDNEGDCAMTSGAVMMANTQNIDAVRFTTNTGTLDEGTIDCFGYAKS